MNPVLKLLIEGGHLTTAQMAQVAGISESEVNQQLEQLKRDGIFLGWRPVLDLSRESAAAVRAVIEVKITPERGGGFNRLAERLSRFEEVLKLLIEGGHRTSVQMAQVAGISESEVNQHLEQLRKDGVFLGWRPVLDLSRERSR